MTDSISPAVDLLATLIRNGCVNNGTPGSGQEHRSVETLAGYFGKGGTVTEPHPGRQSVTYRVPGTRPDAPALLLMGHTDVVPATPDRWTHDPFGGEIIDGFVWGRGAVDMLNLTAAMATVFKPFLTGDTEPLPGDLIFLAVADEEAAGILGAHHLVTERWDLVGAPYVLTEIAYPALETASGPKYPVSVGEKGPFWTKIRSAGEPGHGSTPFARKNALEPLVEAVHTLFTTPAPVVISAEWKAFIEGLELGPDERAELTDPDRIDGALERIAAESPGLASYIHACTHLTVSPNVLHGGVKANMIPDFAEAEIDLRALPGMTRGDIDTFFTKAMGAARDRLEIVPVADHEANSSPISNPLWEVVVDSIEELTGTRSVVPTMMPATTDARFFRERGSIAYGVGLFDDSIAFGDFLAMFHGDDERVSVRSVDMTVQLLSEILERWREAV